MEGDTIFAAKVSGISDDNLTLLKDTHYELQVERSAGPDHMNISILNVLYYVINNEFSFIDTAEGYTGCVT
jgi:hypothetical protein